jgi:hypothetical protein
VARKASLPADTGIAPSIGRYPVDLIWSGTPRSPMTAGEEGIILGLTAHPSLNAQDRLRGDAPASFAAYTATQRFVEPSMGF